MAGLLFIPVRNSVLWLHTFPNAAWMNEYSPALIFNKQVLLQVAELSLFRKEYNWTLLFDCNNHILLYQIVLSYSSSSTDDDFHNQQVWLYSAFYFGGKNYQAQWLYLPGCTEGPKICFLEDKLGFELSNQMNAITFHIVPAHSYLFG